MSVALTDVFYLLAASFFIVGLKRLSTVRTARSGNILAGLGMLLAVSVTLVHKGILRYEMIVAGILIGTILGALTAKLVKMTAMPQMVAAFNGFGGLASALVAYSEFIRMGMRPEPFFLVAIILGIFVGSVTFTGSLVAYGKLQGILPQQPLTYPLQKTGNLLLTLAIIGFGVWLFLDPSYGHFLLVILSLSLLLGILLVLPIGGADMPVVISLLNSYSGIAAAMTGFVLMNKILIVAGSLVGASGIILTRIMCRAMNRSLVNVIFGAFGKIDEPSKASGKADYSNVKSCSMEEAAMILEGASSVILVPGYGMAVAHAQHAVQELTKLLEGKKINVRFAVHPVAGRMPGHMNVLLAEANVPYEQVYEMDLINPEFERTDVALVIGANDVTNPSARDDKGSPIYGMPILNVDKARSTIVIKRSLSPGFAGIKNPLFENESTLLLYSDAKVALEAIIRELKEMG